MNLPKRVIETNAGTSITLPVELTNNQNKKAIFFVSLKNVGDFAQPSLRSVTLNPGQKNTVFLDVIVRDDAEPLVYTGVIEVRSTTKVVASDTITIEVLDAETEEEPVSLFENVPVVFWIILNIVILALIVLAVRFVLQKK
jgi:uncharacterized membrane protein